MQIQIKKLLDSDILKLSIIIIISYYVYYTNRQGRVIII
jgi:hypothetical protein